MREFGLYIHIPYCGFACHYCNFAKTANFTPEHISLFFATLQHHLDAWLAAKSGLSLPDAFSSVFFGGGTPSLFSHEYEPILRTIAKHLAPGAEISLEANPKDISRQHLLTWRDLGFNRISLGVQTFVDRGLKFLTRDHTGAEAEKAVDLAKEFFTNTNIDLIYGWPGQTKKEFIADLDRALASQIPHLSLYNLTYEKKTPFGRLKSRGKIVSMPEEHEEQLFQSAREHLAGHGFEHEEISNWAQPGFSCRHNWLYWQGSPYIGIGPGAHSFLTEKSPFGIRFAYPLSDRQFLKMPAPKFTANNFADTLADAALAIDARDVQSWLVEVVATGLRTKAGISLTDIETRTKTKFKPSPLVQRACDEKIFTLKRLAGEQRLYLAHSEWFREQGWTVAVTECFFPLDRHPDSL